VLFEGPGAGSLPTTSAVVADALDAAVSISNQVYWPHSFRREAGLAVMPVDDVVTRYYLRLGVADRPGVLAHIARVLAEGEISIASVIQKEGGDGNGAEIVIMTHSAREASMRSAIAAMGGIDGFHGVEQMLRVHA
jgi:homoserine dehydrogenase